jgi:predicted Zn finger-like uncharacterized protein
MPGRGQALTRTRCPACGTIFRVTSEQLRLKAGKVRCGHCQTVFNAFDHLQLEEPASASSTPAVPEPDFSALVPPAEHSSKPGENVRRASVFSPEEVVLAPAPEVPPMVVEIPDIPDRPAQNTRTDEPAPQRTGPLPEPPPESPEQTTRAAREAGLVAVRELADTNAYNRWSAGALAGNGFGGFDELPQKSPVWPYMLVFLLLLLVLSGQLGWHYRTEIVLRMPAAADAYAAIGVDVPLPREVGLVSIESSDLQSDAARGLFVLNATLKNRANHAQAWPSLELTLTDINDRVVARRVLEHGDYLLPDTPKDSFPANGETGVRLWIEASDIGATGYRLYIFYP